MYAGVVEITSLQDLKDYYGEYSELPAEFESLLKVFDEIGIKVFIAPEEYFLFRTLVVFITQFQTISSSVKIYNINII